MHEPPVQPDRCALSGNYQLESNPERHDKTPLAAAIVTGCARDVSRVLEAVPLVRLHWKDRFGGMSRTRLLPRLENLPGLTNLRNHLPGGFLFSELEITRRKKGSQEDPFVDSL